MSKPETLALLSGCFNTVAQTCRVASYVALTAGMAGFLAGASIMSLQMQNYMLATGLAVAGARRFFNFASRQAEQYKKDIYYRDHGSFDWPDDTSLAQIAAPGTVKNIVPPHAVEQGNVVNLAAVRDARKKTSPNF